MNIPKGHIAVPHVVPTAAAVLAELRLKSVPEEEINEILELSQGDMRKLVRLATRKRFGEPNAYLRGHVEFLGRAFKIDRRSYIPDSYTSELAERILADIGTSKTVLEVGTGCGWIAVTLKCERPELRVSACDIDPNALALARENATTHGADIDFFESFFVDDAEMDEPDIIVSNVPYGGDADYSDKELEERPQMPPIAICDPEGVTAPLTQLLHSIRNRGWRSKIYLETGYLSHDRLDPIIAGCRSSEHVQTDDFGYLVLNP